MNAFTSYLSTLNLGAQRKEPKFTCNSELSNNRKVDGKREWGDERIDIDITYIEGQFGIKSHKYEGK